MKKVFINHSSVLPSPVAIPASSFIHVYVTVLDKSTFGHTKYYSLSNIEAPKKSIASVFKASLHESAF